MIRLTNPRIALNIWDRESCVKVMGQVLRQMVLELVLLQNKNYVNWFEEVSFNLKSSLLVYSQTLSISFCTLDIY